ncbi:MAG: hypothetical protein E5X64_24445, partial [Mesorhizobium sp.]
MPHQGFDDLVCTHAISALSPGVARLATAIGQNSKTRGTAVTDKKGFFDLSKTGLTRRTALKG